MVRSRLRLNRQVRELPRTDVELYQFTSSAYGRGAPQPFDAGALTDVTTTLFIRLCTVRSFV